MPSFKRKPMKDDPISLLTDAEVRNGVETANRVKELLDSVEKGPTEFALEQAQSLGRIEGTMHFLSDVVRKHVVPTLQTHERRITTNKWWSRAALALAVVGLSVIGSAIGWAWTYWPALAKVIKTTLE